MGIQAQGTRHPEADFSSLSSYTAVFLWISIYGLSPAPSPHFPCSSLSQQIKAHCPHTRALQQIILKQILSLSLSSAGLWRKSLTQALLHSAASQKGHQCLTRGKERKHFKSIMVWLAEFSSGDCCFHLHETFLIRNKYLYTCQILMYTDVLHIHICTYVHTPGCPSTHIGLLHINGLFTFSFSISFQ